MNDSIIEIFSSVQGEGKYIGMRQLFLRFPGCNIKCRFCDTDFSATSICRMEMIPGSGNIEELPNPLSAEIIATNLNGMLAKAHHHSVSLTGGEPLLHADFIRVLAPLLHAPLFLETNGTLYHEMKSVLDMISYISMDIKLPSVTGETLWSEHRHFLELVYHKDVYVKIVVAENTSKEEFLQAVHLMAESSPDTLLVLQPVTPFGGLTAPSAMKLLDFQARALDLLPEVRVIPQAHRMLGLL